MDDVSNCPGRSRKIQDMQADLEGRLLACERDNRRLRAWVMALALLVATTLCLLLLRTATATSPQPSPVGPLRVSELIVVDPQGIERVRIGGEVAGVMLYDRTGQERGGYVTFDTGDNVALTLDGRKSQNALFVAGPDGSTAMQIWHGPHAIELRADENGSRLSHTQAGRPPGTSLRRPSRNMAQVAPPTPLPAAAR
jgi:hypothetical protein